MKPTKKARDHQLLQWSVSDLGTSFVRYFDCEENARAFALWLGDAGGMPSMRAPLYREVVE